MNTEITTAIRANLPAATAAELSDFIKIANQQKIELESAREKIKVLNFQTAELMTKIVELTSELAKYFDLEKREEQLLLSNNKLEVTIARKERDCAHEKTQAIFHLAETVFKNPRLLQSESGNVPIAKRWGEHFWIYDHQHLFKEHCY